MHFLETIQIIKKRREALNISQETLAELSEIGTSTLKNIECGKGNPTFKTLNKITDVLGLEIHLTVKE